MDQKRLRNGGLLVVALFALTAVWVFRSPGTSKPAGAQTPEAVIQAVYTLCMANDYQSTAGYYLGGPEHEPALRQSVCRKITESGSIKGHYVLDMKETAAGVVIQTRNYRNEATRTDGRMIRWTLVRKGGRWLVAEVV